MGGLYLLPGTILPVTVLAVLFLIGVVIYFIPTGVAIARQSSNTVVVVLVNFFLGWSLIGWVVALVLAVTGGPRYRHPYGPYPPQGPYGQTWYPSGPYQPRYDQPPGWNPPPPPGSGNTQQY